MNKYKELCQVYADARQASQQAMSTCEAFAKSFIEKMTDYLGCPVEIHSVNFDEQGAMHFYPAIKLYANPEAPDEKAAEIV